VLFVRFLLSGKRIGDRRTDGALTSLTFPPRAIFASATAVRAREIADGPTVSALNRRRSYDEADTV